MAHGLDQFGGFLAVGLRVSAPSGRRREVEAANSRFSSWSSTSQMLTERAWKRSAASLTEAWHNSLLGHPAGGAFGETPPDGAVIIKGSLQISADQAPEMQSHPVGQEQDRHPHQGHQDEKHRQREGSGQVEPLHHLGQHSHDEQVNAGDQGGDRFVKIGMGRINGHLRGAAEQGTEHQQAAQQQGGGVDCRGGTLRPDHGNRGAVNRNMIRKHQGLTGGINPDGKEQTQAQQHEFDPPSHRPDRGPKGLFQLHQNHNRGQQAHHIGGPASEGQRELPLGGTSQRNLSSHQPAAFRDRHAQWDEERGGQRHPPSAQELPIIAPRVTETEEKPRSRQQRHDEQSPVFPTLALIRENRGETGKYTFAGEQEHAGHKEPARQGAPLPDGGNQRDDAAQNGGGVIERDGIHRFIEAGQGIGAEPVCY